jgi:dihydroneopterin aldolase
MFTVSLHKIRIVAPIGIYPQEQVLCNSFEVDIDVVLASFSEKEFVDYTILNNIIQNVFKQNEKLLEQVAMSISQKVKDQFPFAQKIRVCVRKLNPPMQGDIAYAQVLYEL